MRCVSFICQAGLKPALCHTHHRHQWGFTDVDGPARGGCRSQPVQKFLFIIDSHLDFDE